MRANQDYSKSGFAETTITLGLTACTQNIMVKLEMVFHRGHIKIIQNLDSHKIRLHWVSIFAPKPYGLHMKILFRGDKSRLLKIWIRRK